MTNRLDIFIHVVDSTTGTTSSKLDQILEHLVAIRSGDNAEIQRMTESLRTSTAALSAAEQAAKP